jgi:hypothetical protein
VVALVFIGGDELRAAQIRQVVTGAELTFEALQSGFSTSAPEPGQRARDQVLAHPVASGAFAEAEDLMTMEGKSLRLELDSENANRFCKWWRETPARMHLVVALRRARDAEIELFTGTCDGRIADRPAGPLALGWDRLFVPDGADDTLAQLIEAGELIELRRSVYAAVARALSG